MPNSARQKRRARSVKRVRTLVNQGVAFNPAAASEVAMGQAVRNIQYSGANAPDATRAAASRSIQDRQAGTATSPKGGVASFKPATRRYR